MPEIEVMPLAEEIHGMLNRVQKVVLSGAKDKTSDYDTRNAVAEVLEAQAEAMRQEAVRLKNGKTIMSDKKYRVTRVGAEGDVAEARWTGVIYVDDRDRCWAPVGIAQSGEIVVSLISFRAGNIFGLLKEI